MNEIELFLSMSTLALSVSAAGLYGLAYWLFSREKEEVFSSSPEKDGLLIRSIPSKGSVWER